MMKAVEEKMQKKKKSNVFAEKIQLEEKWKNYSRFLSGGKRLYNTPALYSPAFKPSSPNFNGSTGGVMKCRVRSEAYFEKKISLSPSAPIGVDTKLCQAAD
jgi:hypothetical protein